MSYIRTFVVGEALPVCEDVVGVFYLILMKSQILGWRFVNFSNKSRRSVLKLLLCLLTNVLPHTHVHSHIYDHKARFHQIQMYYHIHTYTHTYTITKPDSTKYKFGKWVQQSSKGFNILLQFYRLSTEWLSDLPQAMFDTRSPIYPLKGFIRPPADVRIYFMPTFGYIFWSLIYKGFFCSGKLILIFSFSRQRLVF